MKEKMYQIGQIIDTHGLKGEVKVRSLTDFSERFQVGEFVYIQTTKEKWLELKIASHRVHQQFELISFEGYQTIDQAEAFKGAFLKIKESQLMDLKDARYYVHDIINCTMYTCEGEKLGKIIDVLQTGANDVWVVERKNHQDLLVPCIKEIIKKVDLTESKVYIEVMEGLLD